jgi:uncharacterized protein YhfF
MDMPIPIPHPQFWRRFLAATKLPDAADRYAGTVTLHDSMAALDSDVEMILSGSKTATSALLAEYHATRQAHPRLGGLSILVDEDGTPFAVIETIEVVVERFSEVDDAFARAHGAGQSLKSWRRHCRSAFAARARELGAPFGEETELVCQRFRLVYTSPEAAAHSQQTAGASYDAGENGT